MIFAAQQLVALEAILKAAATDAGDRVYLHRVAPLHTGGSQRTPGTNGSAIFLDWDAQKLTPKSGANPRSGYQAVTRIAITCWSATGGSPGPGAGGRLERDRENFLAAAALWEQVHGLLYSSGWLAGLGQIQEIDLRVLHGEDRSDRPAIAVLAVLDLLSVGGVDCPPDTSADLADLSGFDVTMLPPPEPQPEPVCETDVTMDATQWNNTP